MASQAEWLPQRVARKRPVLPSTRWWPRNTLSTFTSTSMVWASKKVSLGHSKKSGNLPWMSWGIKICVLIGIQLNQAVWAKGIRNVPIISECDCLKNVITVKVHPISSTLWWPLYLLPLIKIYSQCVWEPRIFKYKTDKKSTLNL